MTMRTGGIVSPAIEQIPSRCSSASTVPKAFETTANW